MKFEFSGQIFEKKTQIQNLIKIRSVRAELFLVARRSDRQTDMTKLIVALRNYATALKNGRNKSGSNTGCSLSTPLIHEE